MESLIPVRDASANIVSQSCADHRPIKEPQAQVQSAKQAGESVNSSEAEAEQGEGEMVVKRTITLDLFCPAPVQWHNSNSPKVGVRLPLLLFLPTLEKGSA